jgi:RimJ/RimL family protein N-acetyltransferase
VLSGADDVAVMVDDEFLRPWSTMGTDFESWIRREIAEARGPSRAICLPDDDRALGRVWVRLPEFASDAVRCEADQPVGELSYWLVPRVPARGLAYAAVRMNGVGCAGSGLRSVVLDIEAGNVASERLAEWLGAQRRAPMRVEVDRTRVRRT